MKRCLALLILLGCTALSVPASVDPKASFVNGREHHGEALAVDFPVELFLENRGAAAYPHAGMCVDSAIEMGALWAGLEEFRGFRDYFAQREQGGNTRQGVDRQIKIWCELKRIPVPAYIQYEGDAPEPLLELADRTGRLACISLGYSPRYGGGPMNHMVNVAKFSGVFAVVLDNNLIGGNTRENLFEWMPPAELVSRMKVMSANGRMISSRAWVFLWAAPGPPPTPHN